MSSKSSSSSGSIGVLGLLGVAFVVLKLTGFIDWSWWWVTAPFWGGFAFIAAILLIVLAVSAFVSRR
jgi:phosphoglycerol transferase MdoB-like AlkP superfamily enzyme